jgi:2-dehydro-3-deoxyphosphogluconate aldolase/(4S)-4-hydroxy-2-oxoglutarate aldolase
MISIEQKAMAPDMISKLDDAAVIAVLVVDDIEHAVPLATALLKGGVTAIELTLRTPAALKAASIIKNQFPEIILGFGTVLTVDQVKAVKDVGADFAVAPGCNPAVIKAAQDENLSFAPGIMTPSDIEIAIENGCKVMKYFPAETSGGIKHLKSISAPYQFLDPQFIPLGGLNINNAATYLNSPLITAIGGSWLAKREMIKSKSWEAITNNCIAINKLIQEIRK